MIYQTVGNSMESLIMDKSQIIVSEKNKYRFGDVVVYDSVRGKMAHRMLIAGKNKCIVVGDNNIKYETIKISDVIGDVVAVISQCGECYQLKRNVSLIILTVFIICFVFIKSKIISTLCNDCEIGIKKHLCIKVYEKIVYARNSLQYKYLAKCRVHHE